MSLHLFLLIEHVGSCIFVRFTLYLPVQPCLYVVVPDICRVIGSLLASFKVQNELFNIAVELVKVDVCQYWRNDSSLWRAAVCVVIFPILPISGLGHLSDDVNSMIKFFILDVLPS